MRVVNASPLLAGWCVSVVPPHALSATFIVKGTFDLKKGAAAVPASEPAGLIGDVHEDDDPSRPLIYPSDFAWFKPNADMLLVGSCHLPKGRPNIVCRVGLRVGKWMKRLAVVGDRVRTRKFVLFSGVSDPAPFTSMKVSYARSYGGTGYPKNPAGRGFVDEVSPEGEPFRPLPNVVPFEDPNVDLEGRPDPAGFGPIVSAWPQRMHKIGSYGPAWLKARWPGFPSDFDWSWFNAAPKDQQLPGYLKGDERIIIENMHPAHETFEAMLPAVRARLFVNESDGAADLKEVRLNLDTMWIDMDRLRLILVWRGVWAIRTPRMREIRDLIVAAEPMSAPAASPATFSDLLKAPPPPPEEPTDSEAQEALAHLADVEAKRAAARSAEVARLGGIYERLKALAPQIAQTVGPPPTLQGPPPEPWTRERVATARDFSDQDLSGLDLSALDLGQAVFAGAKLRGTNLAGTKLAMADFSKADLTGARLTDADLTAADFSDAKLGEANLVRATVAHADFSRASMSRADLTQAAGSGARFIDADLSEAKAKKADFSAADFSGARLASADLEGAKLIGAAAMKTRGPGAILREADLTGFKALAGADFSRADFRACRGEDSVWEGAALEECDFTGAALAGADFAGAMMKRSLLARADLRSARFTEAHLERVNALEANLFRANFEGAMLAGAQFVGANLFEAEFHRASIDGASFAKANLGGTKLA